ncbi:hypothetical protein [Algibacter sp.]|uniref:hypothetical protein n=1 Tax=Algibacter sp. TaxID=1872428 RepID=UPI003C7098DE
MLADKESLSRMKDQFQSQVDEENMSTLYEMFPKGGSYNHAWNGSNKILSKYIAGVAPTKVAWSEYQILPNLVHFKQLKKVIPTIKGNIELTITSNQSGYQLELDSPEQTTAIIGIPKTVKGIKKVFVNGTSVWNKGKKKKSVKGFIFDSESADFLKFKAQSAAWQVKAIYE